ncbi:hypothetical protein BH23CHL2_BH23CHL2_07710 [soil metagenome]
MAAVLQIRKGMPVRGSQGAKLGVVDEVTTDAVSGQPTAFVVKSGFWILAKRKILNVDMIRQINHDPDSIIVKIRKKEFRGIPELAD